MASKTNRGHSQTAAAVIASLSASGPGNVGPQSTNIQNQTSFPMITRLPMPRYPGQPSSSSSTHDNDTLPSFSPRAFMPPPQQIPHLPTNIIHHTTTTTTQSPTSSQTPFGQPLLDSTGAFRFEFDNNNSFGEVGGYPKNIGHPPQPTVSTPPQLLQQQNQPQTQIQIQPQPQTQTQTQNSPPQQTQTTHSSTQQQQQQQQQQEQTAIQTVDVPSSQTLACKDSDGQLSTQDNSSMEGHRYVDITEILNLSQAEAAKKLNIPASTLSKRWKEAARNRKWPWRTVAKIDKEITTLLHNIPPGSPIPPDIEASLSYLLRKRQEELKPVVIRL